MLLSPVFTFRWL